MKREQLLKKMCSPMAAAGAGMAMCLSGGGPVQAATGTFGASNAGQTMFPGNYSQINAFSSNCVFYGKLFTFAAYSHFFFSGGGAVNNPRVHGETGGNAFMYTHNAGFTVGPAIASADWKLTILAPASVSAKFIACRCGVNPNFIYGWAVISTGNPPNTLTMTQWGFDPTGGEIRTLSDSVSAKKLALSDGRLKLNWTNRNEQGVARYEVQARNNAGEWTTVDSDVPGAGRYAATVTPGVYRLVVENVDGTTEEIAF